MSKLNEPEALTSGPEINATPIERFRQGVNHGVMLTGNLVQSLRDRFQNVLNPFTTSTSRRILLRTGAVLGSALVAESIGLSVFPRTVRAQEEAEVAGVKYDGDAREVIEEIVEPAEETALVAQTPPEAIQELTPHQKVVNNLREFYQSLRSPAVFTPWDPNEIEAYANNPDKRVFTTFEIMPGPKNKPLLFVLTGGKSGLNPSLGNITSIREAIRLINLADPEMMPLLTSDGYDLRGISGMYSRSMPEAATTYDPRRGMVLINETDHPKDHLLPGAMMAYLLTEARIIHTLKDSMVIGGRTILLGKDKMDDNPGIDKNLWGKSWGEKYQHLFDGNAYSSFMAVINTGSKHYAANWP